MHGMNEPHPTACPTCKGEIARVFNQRFIPPADMFWENENNGRGRFIGSIGGHKDPNSYCRSRLEAKEKLMKRGYASSQIELA
jgi:hypothetical protein